MWSLKQIKEFIKGTTKDISTLVDKDGHERFIEGDITINEISGITQSYGKWTLSGSHLLIVIACSVADETILSNNLSLCEVNLPDWVKDKLVPIVSATIDAKNTTYYGSDWYDTQTSTYRISKQPGNKIVIINASTLTLNKDRAFRVAFDLLIDND